MTAPHSLAPVVLYSPTAVRFQSLAGPASRFWTDRSSPPGGNLVVAAADDLTPIYIQQEPKIDGGHGASAPNATS